MMASDSARSCSNIASICAPKSGPSTTALISSLCRKLRQSRLVEPMVDHTPSITAVLACSRAARRGVDVKIILPSHTDSGLVFHAGRSYYDDLLSKGVKIYERRAAQRLSRRRSAAG